MALLGREVPKRDSGRGRGSCRGKTAGAGFSDLERNRRPEAVVAYLPLFAFAFGAFALSTRT